MLDFALGIGDSAVNKNAYILFEETNVKNSEKKILTNFDELKEINMTMCWSNWELARIRQGKAFLIS